MTYFYLIIIGLSGLFLALQLVSWVFFRRRLFPQTGLLFENTKYKLEWQTIFPKNMTRLIIVIFCTAFFGFLLECLGAVSWLSMPLGAIGGLAVNFALNMWITPLYYRIHHEGEPKPEQLSGFSATVVEEISEEYYGRIQVNNGRSYFYLATSANGRTLPSGTKVIVIEYIDGLCFVESEEHFCDVLFEEEAAETAPEEASEESEESEEGAEKYIRPLDPDEVLDIIDFHSEQK